jgi:hypothetical protein
VVETVLPGLDLYFSVPVLLRIDVDGVAQVGVEVVEVGDETIKFDILHLNSWEVQVFFGVSWEPGLVPLEVQDDPLVELVERGVAEGSFVVFQGGGCDMVLVQGLVGVTQKVTSVDLEGAVVLAVGTIRIGLDQIAKNIDAFSGVQIDSLAFVLLRNQSNLVVIAIWGTYGVDVASVDGITDSPLVVLDVGVAVSVLVVSGFLTIVVEVLVQMGIVGPGWELQTVRVLQRWIVTSFERYFVVEVLDFAETVGQTFQVVPGQDLLVDEVVLFTTTVAFVVEIFTTQPVRVVDAEVVVERVDADIFSEVRQGLFRVQVQVVPRVVGVDGVTVVVVLFLWTLSLVLLLVFVSLLDDFVVVEVVRVDLVDWGEDNSVSVRTVDDGNGESIQVDSFVDVLTCPNSSLVEGFVVFSIVEELVQSNCLFLVFLVEHGEDLAPWEQSILVDLVVVFGNFGFL